MERAFRNPFSSVTKESNGIIPNKDTSTTTQPGSPATVAPAPSAAPGPSIASLGADTKRLTDDLSGSSSKTFAPPFDIYNSSYNSANNALSRDAAFTKDFLKRHQDNLAGKHGNTQVPKMLGSLALHKTYAGLRDAYRFTGNRTALELEINYAKWAESIVGRMSDAQIQRMLNTEFGGMNEVFADLYADTGDPRWLALSYKFEHRAYP